MFIDSRDLRLLAVQGLSMAEIARELKQPYFRVRKCCQLYGIDVRWDVPGKPPKVKAPKLPRMPKAPKPPRVNPHAERNERMALMYRQGLSLEQIGEHFSLTRERIRQVLRKGGTMREHGGATKRGESRKQALIAKREGASLARWGVSVSKAKELRQKGALKAFKQQRRNAHSRGVDWNLNLAQWWDVWEASGKWEQRGRGAGAYCMSRIKDSGGYVVGNVHIQLNEENCREAVKKWSGKKKTNRGVFCLYPGNAKPWLASIGGLGGIRLGFFATEAEAVSARMKYASEKGLRVCGDGRILLKAA